MLIHELNEEILPDGLIPALEQIFQRQQQLYPITIHAQLDYPTGLLPLNRELDILRIVQEALTNAIRHGSATEAWISVGCDYQDGTPVAIHVQVHDNGQGFDTNQRPGSGWGLRNMQRRAEQLGAALHIRSQPGAVTVVDLAIPLRAESAPDASPQSAG